MPYALSSTQCASSSMCISKAFSFISVGIPTTPPRSVHSDLLLRISQPVSYSALNHGTVGLSTPRNMNDVLGDAFPWPKGYKREEIPRVKYFTLDDWNKHEQAEANKDTHDGQHFMEDENGTPVSGIVAADVRDKCDSLLTYIFRNGYGSASYKGGTGSMVYPAVSYLYRHLTTQFPWLLLCDDGKWKTDLLVTQSFSLFARTYGFVVTKQEDEDVDADFDEDVDVDEDEDEDEDEQTKKKRKRSESSSDFGSVEFEMGMDANCDYRPNGRIDSTVG